MSAKLEPLGLLGVVRHLEAFADPERLTQFVAGRTVVLHTQVKLGQADQVAGYCGMVVAETALVDGERAAQVAFGFVILLAIQGEVAEIEQRGGGDGMRGTQVAAWLLRKPGVEPNRIRLFTRSGWAIARFWPI